MSYSFSFEIVRWYNKSANEWLTEQEFNDKLNELPENQHEKVYESFTEELIKLNVKGAGYYRPARTWGDPSLCYPEDEDCHLSSSRDHTGYDWLDELTDSEQEKACQLLMKKIHNRDYDVDCDSFNYYDFDYSY